MNDRTPDPSSTNGTGAPNHVQDEREPSPSDGAAGVESYPPPIPLARPVVMPAYAPVPVVRRHDILLDGMSRLAALADVGMVVILLIAAEFVTWAVTIFTVSLASGATFDPALLDDPMMERDATMVLLPFRAVSVLLIALLLLKMRRQTWRAVGASTRRWVLDPLIGIGSMVAAFVLIYMWQFLVWVVWPDLLEQMAENADRLITLIPKMHPLALLAVACTVGLYEELLFRGLIMPRLRRVSGSWIVAILISTALFTSLHIPDQTLAALGPITIISLVFSVVTVWRRSIVPAIVGHAMFDFAQFMGLYFIAGDKWT